MLKANPKKGPGPLLPTWELARPVSGCSHHPNTPNPPSDPSTRAKQTRQQRFLPSNHHLLDRFPSPAFASVDGRGSATNPPPPAQSQSSQPECTGSSALWGSKPPRFTPFPRPSPKGDIGRADSLMEAPAGGEMPKEPGSAALRGALGLQRRAGLLAGRGSLLVGGLEASQSSPGQPSPSPRGAPHPAAFSQAPHPRRADRKLPSLPRVTQRPWLAQVCPWRGVGRGRRRAGQVVSRTGENSSPPPPSSFLLLLLESGPRSGRRAKLVSRSSYGRPRPPSRPGPAPRRAGAQLATVPRGQSPPSPGLSAARALPPVHGSRGALSSRGRAGRRLPSPGVCAAL